MTYTLSPGSPSRGAHHPTNISPSSSSYTSSPIRHSPLSQPPVFAPTRTPSPSQRHKHKSEYGDTKPISTPRQRLSSHVIDLRGYQQASPIHSHSPHTPQSVSPRYPAAASPSSPNSTFASHPNPSPPLSRSQPLLGSYPLSLLHSRMSHAHPAHPPTDGFSMHLGSMGKGKACPSELRCPKHLIVPFSATHYSLKDETDLPYGYPGAKSTPWVGNVDLETHFIDRFSQPDVELDSGVFHHREPDFDIRHISDTFRSPPPVPGYEVAARGQLQILIKTTTAPLKVFLLPYDLRKVPIGGRLLVRENTYLQTTSGGGAAASPSKEVLKFAIQLQFVCVSAETPLDRFTDEYTESWAVKDCRDNTKTAKWKESTSFPCVDDRQASFTATSINRKAYYVTKSIRIVFSSACDPTDEIRAERHDELIDPPPGSSATVHSFEHYFTGRKGSAKRRQSDSFGSFSPSSPAGSSLRKKEEWEAIRRKWAAGQALYSADEGDDEVAQTTGTHSARDVDDSDLFMSKSEGPHLPLSRPTMNRRPSLLSTTQPQAQTQSDQIHRQTAHQSASAVSSMEPSSSVSRMSAAPLVSPTPTLSPIPIKQHTHARSHTTTHPQSQSHNRNSSHSSRHVQSINPSTSFSQAQTSALTLARPTTPTLLGNTPRPTSPSVWSPGPGNRRMTREDGREEVELSERLRRMGMGIGYGDSHKGEEEDTE